MLLGTLDSLQRVLLLRRGRTIEVKRENIDVAGDGAERRAQLVTHGSQEIPLGPIRILGGGARLLLGLVEPRALQRERALGGNRQQQLAGFSAEVARLPECDTHYSDATTGNDQRRNHLCLVACLSENTDEVRVVITPIGW